MLFGSSPLTEPEDDFPAVTPEGDNGEKCIDEVMSSQQSERQDIILDRTQEVAAAVQGETSDKPAIPSPSRPVDHENQDGSADAVMDKKLGSAVEQTAQPVIATSTVLNVPVGDKTTEAHQQKADALDIELKQTPTELPIGRGSDKSLEGQVLRECQQPKMEVVPEDSPDDEFDDDPWFDEACLESFDAIDASMQQSTTHESRLSAPTQPRPTSTPRISSPPLSLKMAPTLYTQLPSFSQNFVDTRKAEEIDEKEIPVTVGFSTGRGKKVTISTTAAARQNARTAKLMQELLDIQNEVITIEQPGVVITGKVDGDAASRGRGGIHQQEPIESASTAAAMETPIKNRPSASAFTTAGGSQLGAVSDAARDAIDSFFEGEPRRAMDGGTQDHRMLHPAPSQNSSQKASLFTTMAGSTLATPSADAQQTIAALFNAPSQSISRPTDYAVRPAHSAVMSLAIPSKHFETPTKSLPRSEPLVAQSTALDLPRPSTLRPTSLQDISNLQPSSPTREHSVSTFRTPLPVKMVHRASQAKPFQTPLPSQRQMHMPLAPTRSARTGLSPALPRRVGLGMTPRSISGLRERPRFVSPFRTTVHDEESESAGSPSMKSRPGIRAIFSAPSLKQPKQSTTDLAEPQSCFQLTCESSLGFVQHP